MAKSEFDTILEGEFYALVEVYQNALFQELGKAQLGLPSNVKLVLSDLANASALYGAIRSEAWLSNHKNAREIKARLDKAKS